MKRILVIGVGSIGERHLRCFQATGKVEVFICESNEALAGRISEKYGCPWYASVESALKAQSLDAAIVCTPAHTHIGIASLCLRRHLHVLIEKPLAVSMDGLEEFRKLAEESGRAVRVAYVHHCLLQFLALRDLLDQDLIGESRHVVVTTGQNFPSFRPAYREIYYARHETGGGAIQDALTHILNSVEWLIAPIASVFALGDRLVLDGVEVEDTVNLVAKLGNGALASFAINQFQAPNEATLSIHGARGSLRMESHQHRVGVMRHGDSDWQWTPVPTEERDAGFVRQAEAFLTAMEGGGNSLATLEEAMQTLRVNLAALKSVRTHQEVAL